ncbi:hypothetical protein [Plasmodium yoelii yoelii]|uniref:Uncharacterized protein n=1 Tax=Plasmodium yoelii yoelii TaxID=73239 RepID=Q7PD99_PLAYO|nr:hypothetical protein [Plasmodium yoelii yoelii]EAA21715.1 hypothetical protein [Plasmodium yoelii yoelii]
MLRNCLFRSNFLS